MRAVVCLLLIPFAAPASDPVRVLVWDERQPRQAEAYDNFLGNEIAAHLRGKPGLEVQSVGLDDPGQGLDSLNDQDVLVWWGHVRHGEVSKGTGLRIIERIRAGQLALVALHSAHWSVPFMEAMFSRTREDAKLRFPNPNTKTSLLELCAPSRGHFHQPTTPS